MLCEEVTRRASIQYDVDISVARIPWILEQLAPKLLEPFSRSIAQVVQGRTQWPTPLLIPARLAPCVTAAVANPSTNTVPATPRRPFIMRPALDLNFMLRRIAIKKLAVIRDPKTFARRLHRQHVRQAQIAKLEMVPVSLAVCRDVHHRFSIRRRLNHPHQQVARRQRLLKSDRPRQ